MVKWSNAYSTGVERVDAQHKMIFQMAADFRAALDEGLGERAYPVLLRSLDLYIRTHFGFEEGCMGRHHCPVAQQNSEAHKQFVKVLAGFQGRFASSGFDRDDAQSLVDTIDRWLVDHICRIDVQLKAAVERAP